MIHPKLLITPICGLLAVTLGALPALAQKAEVAPIFRAILDCRAITAAEARLACFDKSVAEIETAQRTGDVVIADKRQVRESKRGLFGFGKIRLPIFANDDSEITEITAKIQSVRDIGYNKFEYSLDDGSRWRQLEGQMMFPKAGQQVTIKSAALGSYMLKVGNRSAVRAMRIE